MAPGLSIGPRVRKSPFFDATIRYGAKAFTIYNHMYMPTVFTGAVAEYWQVVQGVTLWDVGCERQVEVTGPDAAAFVQLLTPRKMEDLQVGCCRYALLTDEAGGIVNDALALRLADNHFWLSPGDSDVLLWAQGVAVAAGMDVTLVEPDVSPLQLQGPKSAIVARALFGDDILSMKYFHFRELELDGIPLVVSRTGWCGEFGYEFFLRDGRQGADLWEKVMAAGKAEGIVPAAPNVIRSIEGALLSYRSDMTQNDNPWTVGLERLVDLDQPADFIGKAALQSICEKGPERLLVGVEIDGPPLAGNDALVGEPG
jgi:glycine cleavage system aminomethyltransferase T